MRNVKAPKTLLRFMNAMKAVVRASDAAEQEVMTELFLGVATSARVYVSIVCEAELERRTRTRGRESFADLDRRRTICHDSFIGSVNSCNRACERVGVPLIYAGGEDRRAYGDYALQLVDELFGERL